MVAKSQDCHVKATRFKLTMFLTMLKGYRTWIKPYWGAPPKGPLWPPHGKVVIVHTHGPKIEQVLCMHKYIQQYEGLFIVNKTLMWDTMWTYYEMIAPQVRVAGFAGNW